MRSLLILLCGPVVAWSAPALKTKTTLYHSTTVGDTFEFEMTFGKSVSSHSETIEKVESTPDGYVVSVARTAGKSKPITSNYLVNEKGIARLSGGSIVYNPPMVLLKLPAKANNEWINKVDAAIQQYTLKVIGEEDVEVPAGKFKAIRVETTGNIPQFKQDVKMIHWYAPNLGVVKQATIINETERVYVLKVYKPAKR